MDVVLGVKYVAQVVQVQTFATEEKDVNFTDRCAACSVVVGVAEPGAALCGCPKMIRLPQWRDSALSPKPKWLIWMQSMQV